MLDFSKLSTHLCVTPEEKITAGNIRYQAYCTVEYNPPDKVGLFNDELDAKDNHFSFLAKLDGIPFATMRAGVITDRPGWDAITCQPGFVDEIADLKTRFDGIVEMGRLAVLPGYSDHSAMAPIALFLGLHWFQRAFDNLGLVCTTGRSHKRFYERHGFKQVTDFAPRPNAAIDLALMVKDASHDRPDTHPMLSEEEVLRLMPTIPDHISDQLLPLPSIAKRA
ncbi:N-acyl amino acid synthase FeeM domain-containing protein [Salinibius halmophilus]|uniref:N-acyl amino acid synthase FeeM domain-containing protein n=1 Tax=Salinibius halmophilus TaxID=1853216 RepID=UPI000E668580|nr:hypothetical protein [Salinibius halmophilus]